MKVNAKVKALSLAMFGLTGMALAGSAMAVCPSALTPPWTATLQVGTNSTVSSQTGGYDTTECRMRSALGQNTNLNAKAAVRDDTPANELRYRAQFIIDPHELPAFPTNRSVTVFAVNGSSAPAGFSQALLTVVLTGNGTAPAVFINASDTAAPGGAQGTPTAVALPNATGPNRIEIDLTVANGTGSLKYWIKDAAASYTEAQTTGQFTGLTNSAWTGADAAILGEINANLRWRQNFTATNYVYFDQFDSRRQTFIGH